MNVACPYCRKVIALKSVKPGRFTPKCPGCAKVFVLTVPADAAKKPTVAPREPAPAPAAAPVPAAALEQTAPALSGVAAAKPAAAAPPALDQTAPIVTPAPDQTSASAAPAPALDQTAALSAPALDQTAAAAPAAPGATDAWTPGQSAAPVDQTEAFSPSAAAGKLDTTEAVPPGARTGSGARDATRVGGGSGDDLVPPALGGYTIVKLLGKGGMGAVYLARQVSLDRNVALKVMNARAASDPTFIARFTREAYAAAQLVHHNIVQIYDIGEEQGMPFFSMEFVRGENLAQVTGQQGKLDPEEAVGYVLQAARGLKFAHDQGMVHRDIKPDNLMLNDQGIVKVADLGLVKTAGMSAADDQAGGGGDRPASLTGLSSVPDVTTVGVAMGTPLYMAPEQGRNAAAVDQRADIYSLGCTLYVMLTGRPPFTGKTPLEVMTKHLTEPVIPPEVIVKRVPKELSAILLKMLAKKPEERYPDLGAVIADLEKFLGVSSAGPFTPKEEHAAALESAVKQFNEAPAARQRAVAVPAFFGVLALLVFLCAVFGLPLWAAGAIGLGLMTVLGTFLTSGIIYRTHLFLKARETLLESSWSERLRWSAYVLLVLVMLGLFGLLPILIGLALVAAGVCALYHILVERQLVTERAKAMAKAEKLLKTLRLRGLEEDALRQFVAKYSGDRWEELYEALFGYELMVQARQRLAATEGGKRRSRHAAWRDPIIQWMEARQRAAREKRERKHLQKVEQKRLEAEGLDKTEASRRAAAAADVMVEAAAGMKQAGDVTEPIIEGAPAAPPKPLFNAKQMMEAAERAEREHTERVRPKGPGLLQTLYAVTIGPQPRFLVALVLIFGCALWVYQNQDLQNTFKDVTRSALDSGSVDASKLAVETKSLRLPGLPEWASRLFSSFNPAVAGVLLIFSGIWRNPRITLFFFAAVAVMLAGPQLGLPENLAALVRVKQEWIWLGAGLALAVIGVAVDRLLTSDKPEPRR